MNRRLVVISGSLSAALFAAGCERTGRDDVTLSAIQADQAPAPSRPGFSQRADCTPMGTYAGPAVGSRYVYRRADGTLSAREIMTVHEGTVGFRYHDLSRPGSEPLPTRHAIAGMLVIYPEPQSARRVVYEEQPLSTLSRIRAGETVSIPTVETSTLRGSEQRLSFPTTVAFRMCGDLAVGGVSVPVRVYSVGSARRVIDRRTGDHVRQGEVTYYLSALTGYPLVFQDSATTVVERIEETP